MYSINGIGTKLYGKREKDVDGSYVATKWFIFFLLPIIPLGSFRVCRGETSATGIPFVFPGATTQYKMVNAPLNWKQIGNTYLTVYGTLFLFILDLIYDPNFYILKSLFIIGSLYAIYYVFVIDKKNKPSK